MCTQGFKIQDAGCERRDAGWVTVAVGPSLSKSLSLSGSGIGRTLRCRRAGRKTIQIPIAIAIWMRRSETGGDFNLTDYSLTDSPLPIFRYPVANPFRAHLRFGASPATHAFVVPPSGGIPAKAGTTNGRCTESQMRPPIPEQLLCFLATTSIRAIICRVQTKSVFRKERTRLRPVTGFPLFGAA
jgi:hypothetical protein